MVQFESLLHMIDSLQSEEKCRLHLEHVRWPNGQIVCPHCGSVSKKHYRLTKDGKFEGLHKCKDCRERFTVTVGAMFENSHVPLRKWFLAIYMFLSHKKGISSVQLAKDINVTQKTAWFMLNRIRDNMKSDSNFDDTTQVDETYVGGRSRKHKNNQGRSLLQKTPVMGLLSDGKVHTEVIPNASGNVLKGIIKDFVKFGTTIVSDGWRGYKGLSEHYKHVVVEHSKGVYVNNGFHTNSIEGFWSQLKRGIIGIYHLVSSKHLQRYCNEFEYRYNTRHLSDGERLYKFLLECNNRLKYAALIC